jgi:hypothetical protein
MSKNRVLALILAFVTSVICSINSASANSSVESLKKEFNIAINKTASIKSAVSWTLRLYSNDSEPITIQTKTDTRGGIERSGIREPGKAQYLVNDLAYISTDLVPEEVLTLLPDSQNYQWLTRTARKDDRFPYEVKESIRKTGSMLVISESTSATKIIKNNQLTLIFKKAKTKELVTVFIVESVISKITVKKNGVITATITLGLISNERILTPLGMSATFPQTVKKIIKEKENEERFDLEQEPIKLDELEMSKESISKIAKDLLETTQKVKNDRKDLLTIEEILLELEAIVDDRVGSDVVRVEKERIIIEFYNINDKFIAICLYIPLQVDKEGLITSARCNQM